MHRKRRQRLCRQYCRPWRRQRSIRRERRRQPRGGYPADSFCAAGQAGVAALGRGGGGQGGAGAPARPRGVQRANYLGTPALLVGRAKKLHQQRKRLKSQTFWPNGHLSLHTLEHEKFQNWQVNLGISCVLVVWRYSVMHSLGVTGFDMREAR